MNLLLILFMLIILVGAYFFFFQREGFQDFSDKMKSKFDAKERAEAKQKKEEEVMKNTSSSDHEMLKSITALLELNSSVFKYSKNNEIINLTKDITETMINIFELLNSKNHYSAIFNAMVNKYFPSTINNYLDVIRATNVTNTDIKETEDKLIAKLTEFKSEIIKVPSSLENSIFDELDKAFLIMEEMLKEVK